MCSFALIFSTFINDSNSILFHKFYEQSSLMIQTLAYNWSIISMWMKWKLKKQRQSANYGVFKSQLLRLPSAIMLQKQKHSVKGGLDHNLALCSALDCILQPVSLLDSTWLKICLPTCFEFHCPIFILALSFGFLSRQHFLNSSFGFTLTIICVFITCLH